MFDLLLYSSLSVFCVGLVYKVSTWFTRSIGIRGQNCSPFQRVGAFLNGILGVLLSKKIFILAKGLLLDVLLQRRIYREDFLRWLMHMLIFCGFMLLLFMHALGQIVTARLFSNYYPTANPFLFLRSLFGLMVLAGAGIAVFRRFVLKVPRLKTDGPDRYAIFIVAAVILSGILFEGLKITSYSEFNHMAVDYGDLSGKWAGDKDQQALESYWVKNFGLVSPHVKGPVDQAVLAKGQEINEMSCADCHASPKWAFAGYGVSRVIAPFALRLNRAGAVNFLWYIHILFCFIGLAYLPFSKMFHVLATPVSLLANAVMDSETAHPANVMTRQVMELDACTHCGTCSLRCSALMAFEAIGNEYILPSEKMTVLKRMAAGNTLSRKELRALLEGIYLCTNCDRCTVTCPSGINLRELWFNARERLIQEHRTGPMILSQLSFARGLGREQVFGKSYPKPLEEARGSLSVNFDVLMNQEKPLSFPPAEAEGNQPIHANTYSYCFGCQNCTTVCPVVENYEDPQEALELLPHQIMWCLGSGLIEAASSSAMVWNCLTCYQCQEHCPQKVKVTDLLYELKNWALKNLEKSDKPRVSRAA